MGKQLGFYLSPEEEDEILQEIRGMNAKIVDDEGLPVLSSEPRSTLCYIVAYGGKIQKYNATSKYIDTIISDVIEFRRTEYHPARGAMPGRIWTELRYWNKEGMLLTKDKVLDDLYKQIIKAIKKRTKKIDGSPFYISQKSREYITENNLKIYGTVANSFLDPVQKSGH